MWYLNTETQRRKLSKHYAVSSRKDEFFPAYFLVRTACFLISAVWILLSIINSLSYAADALSDALKVRTAVFPFNDISTNTLDQNIPAVLKSELSRHEFIDVIPVEIITKKLYEIEPSLLWTEKDAGQKRGGILWSIQPKIVEEVNRNVSADYSIYGDLTRFEDKWKIDAHVIKGNDLKTIKSFSVTGEKQGEIPEKLPELAKQVVKMLRANNAVHEAEEHVRRYLGGIYTYHTAVAKISGQASEFPESLTVNALLLDLYTKHKDEYRDEIIKTGSRVITLYDPANGEDTRYLLSLNLDPFDVVAGLYEESLDLERAIDMRHKAMELFPFRTDVHRAGIGKDHYVLAQTFEKKDQKAKALENYKKALSYLSPSSEYYSKASEGIERIK